MTVYEDGKRSLSWFDLNKMLRKLKTEETWLKEAYSQSLQQAVRRVDLAFRHFFRRLENGETPGFPRFKSKRILRQSFDIPQFFQVEPSKNRVKLPKIGRLKAVLHRQFEGQVKCATVTMTSTRKYFIHIVVDTDDDLPQKSRIHSGNTVGMDLGFLSYATLSTGEKIENPRHLERSIQRLRILQRRLGRKQ